MNPQDPRHGSGAGAQQHYKDGEKPCTPCLHAAYVNRKRIYLQQLHGHTNLVQLGQPAYNLVNTYGDTTIQAITGLGKNEVFKVRHKGPTGIVHRTTQHKILTADYTHVATPIGIQRRLQAVSYMGWSARIVAAHTGIHLDTLKRLRRHPDPQFVCADTITAVVKFYNTHHMTVAPNDHSSRLTRQLARREGYASSFAWDNIDDPNEKPILVRDHDGAKRWTTKRPAKTREALDRRNDTRRTKVDPVKVERILAGEKLNATLAEKRAVTGQWMASGRPLKQLEAFTGWRADRYHETNAAA